MTNTRFQLFADGRATLFCGVIGSDCTAGGVTSGRSHVTLGRDLALVVELSPVGAAPGYVCVLTQSAFYALTGLDVPNPGERVARVRAVPFDSDGAPDIGGMFGGHYVETSDRRFPVEGRTVPVFDRFER